jgi:hypothetical protein
MTWMFQGLALVLVDVVDRADARVAESGGGAGLALETLLRLVTREEPLRQELQGHAATQARVLGPVDDTHAATAELLENAVMGDGLADHEEGAPSAPDTAPLGAVIRAGFYNPGIPAAHEKNRQLIDQNQQLMRKTGMSRPLRFYFPEWQGYASHDGSRRGSRLIREQVSGPRDFTDVEVAPGAALATERGIVGREAIVQNTRSCRGRIPSWTSSGSS